MRSPADLELTIRQMLEPGIFNWARNSENQNLINCVPGCMDVLCRRRKHRHRHLDSIAGPTLDPPSPNLAQETSDLRQYLPAENLVRSIPHIHRNPGLTTTSVVLGIIAEMCLVHRTTRTEDPTYDFCEVVIAQQVIQCVSMVTACWGQLKPFLTWLRSNGLRIQDAEFATAYASKSFAGSQTQSASRERRTRHSQDVLPLSQRNQILVTQDWEVGSQSSRAPVIQENDPWVEASGARQSPELRL